MTASEKLYGELAEWFHLLTAPEDYAEEAAFFRTLFLESCDPPVETILELGSGGGNNASHLKTHFQLTLVDRSPEMLEVSRRLNPKCEHRVGDMCEVQLRRVFDGVFIHDAVTYLTSEADLARTMETAFAHTKPGGAVVIAPDCVRETFDPETKHGGHDGVDGRGLRYVEWTWDPDPADTTYTVDFAYLLRERDGSVRAVHDRHVLGLFPRDSWLRLLAEAGFRARSVTDPDGREVFVGRRPRSA